MQRRTDLLQRPVADVMAERVVDFLEIIEVHHEQRDLGSKAAGACELAPQVPHHESIVRQARQRVGERILAGLLEDE